MTHNRLPKGVFISIAFILSVIWQACGPSSVDPRLFGYWQTKMSSITVREEVSRMNFEFTTGQAECSIVIHEDMSVTGIIGGASLKNGVIGRNRSLLPPSITGVGYRVETELEGKIFDEDPLGNQQVELWIIHPMTDHDSFQAGLRYTQNNAQFPMAQLTFNRIEGHSSNE